MSSPTQRTLDHCRKMGWLAAVVEKWIPQTKRRADVFGFGDVLVLDGYTGSLLIQACTAGDMSTRLRKIAGKDCIVAAKRWLAAGNRIEVWGFGKRTVGKRTRWVLKSQAVTLHSLRGARLPEVAAGSVR